MNHKSKLIACGIVMIAPLFSFCSDKQEDGATIEILPGKSICTDVSSKKQEKSMKARSVSQTTTDKAKASSAFELGERCARKMIESSTTTDEIRDGLLELRAREYAIRCQAGEDAASEYLEGIRHYLIESGDTLANILF